MITTENQSSQQIQSVSDACIKVERFGNRITVTLIGEHNDLVTILYHAGESNQALLHLIHEAAKLAAKIENENMEVEKPIIIKKDTKERIIN